MKTKKSVIVLCIIVFVMTLGLLEFYGFIWHNEFFIQTYDVKGLDVSHYQNNINWNKVSNEDYKFIYIKATEGEDFVDKTFAFNWKGAIDNGFLVGAYHFFVTSSTGESQANNFINLVPIDENSLPPVIDIEISKNEDKEIVRENLAVMIKKLYEVYQKRPVLYVTYTTYNAFIQGYFEECDIWIRDIIKSAKLADDRAWSFWQYCNRGRIQGIDTYVDINVFHGTEKELFDFSKIAIEHSKEDLEFTDMIAEKLIVSLKEENYDDLYQLYIYPKYGDEPIDSKLIDALISNYKSVFDLDSISYEYTGEVEVIKETKHVNYFKYVIRDAKNNEHFIKIGNIDNIGIIMDSMFEVNQ